MSDHVIPARLKRRPWISRLLLMPYFFWRHYQVGRGTTSRRYRLIAAVHMAWLTIRPDWMRPKTQAPGGRHGGSMRLTEGPTMRSGLSDSPRAPKPTITPHGQGAPVKPSFPSPRRIREDFL